MLTMASDGPLLLEHEYTLEKSTELQFEDILVHPNKEGVAYAIISNPTGCSSCVNAGTIIGTAVKVDIIERGEVDKMLVEPKGGKLPTVKSIILVTDRKKNTDTRIVGLHQ